MKKIAFVTTQRSEYNASRYVIQAIVNDPEFELSLITGWAPKGEIDIPVHYIRGYGVELMPIVLSATIHGIPIAHIDGGQISQGSVDNLTRFAISRYAHL